MALFKLCVLAVLLSAVAANLDLSRSIDLFGGQFSKESLKQTKDDNSIVSPISAEIALAMILEGSSGTTEAEIRHALALEGKTSVSQSFKNLIEVLGKVENVKLNIANAIFTPKPLPGNPEQLQSNYQALVRKDYKAEIKDVDFSKPVETAAYINKWVEDQTNNKIKDLVKANELNRLTKAVLINAIYFKGDWLKPFKESSTYKQNFTRSNGSPVEVEMMNQHGDFLYQKSDELKSQILVLPYKNEDMKFIVILPDEVTGLPALETKLQSGSNQYLQNLKSSDVHITLPKFIIETTLDVKKICENLGIKKLFTPQADLGRIEPGLFFEKAIQKAFIEVNERGSEAAAATAFHGLGASYNPSAVFFVADHPFYFAIIYKEEILFSGSYRSG